MPELVAAGCSGSAAHVLIGVASATVALVDPRWRTVLASNTVCIGTGDQRSYSDAVDQTQTALQRRTVGTLVTSQVLGGVGTASGIAVMALLTKQVSGSEALAGLGTTAQVLGGALLAIPVARLSAARGRRPGLVLGYGVATAGAALVIAAAILASFPLLLLGSLLFGGGTAAGSQSRFAGADLAAPHRRGRDLSLVVWATTIGSVAGPNLVGVADRLGLSLGLPEMAGSFLFALAGFAAAALVLTLLLRPDPLLEARRRAALTPSPGPAPAARGGVAALRAHPTALVAVLVVALGHAVMVAVMVMTPIHMDHGGASLQLVGLVISVHIFGMYVFSPLVGGAVDRLGPRPVAGAGGLVLVLACVLAATSDEGMSTHLTVALFLLGLGWSCTLVSGSTMLTDAVTLAERPQAQGVSDTVMGLMAAAGGVLAGVVIAAASYSVLAWASAVLAALVCVAAARPTGRRVG